MQQKSNRHWRRELCGCSIGLRQRWHRMLSRLAHCTKSSTFASTFDQSQAPCSTRKYSWRSSAYLIKRRIVTELSSTENCYFELFYDPCLLMLIYSVLDLYERACNGPICRLCQMIKALVSCASYLFCYIEERQLRCLGGKYLTVKLSNHSIAGIVFLLSHSQRAQHVAHRGANE